MAYIVKDILNKRVTDENELEYFRKKKVLPNSDNALKPVELLNFPKLVKAYDDSLKYKSLNKKRNLSSSENISSGCVLKTKINVDESNDKVLNINCLPKEILLNIFHYLSHNELGRIGRVCKTWHKIASNPVLWQKVYVFFRWEKGNQTKVALKFLVNLPICVTHLKLYFEDYYQEESLNFEKFCVTLGKKCPFIKTLILHDTNFSVSLQSAIDLCRQHMQHLEVLSFRHSTFTDYAIKEKYGGDSKIKILDIFNSYGIENSSKLKFSKMPYLKKMNLVQTCVNDSWFMDGTSFLSNLEILNLQCAVIGSTTFKTLQNYAINLFELYLCDADLNDNDFNFRSSAFPNLKTICLTGCHKVTFKGIVSLICTCQSLHNVYVSREVAKSYAMHPFIVGNICKLEIVEDHFKCLHYVTVDYLNNH